MADTRATSLKRAAALLALAGALALAGCGVKGPPEPPQTSIVKADGTVEKKPVPPPDPNRPFILDWLL